MEKKTYSDIVVLTQEQKNDLLEDFPEINFTVIPNSYPKPSLAKDIIPDRNRIIVVSRLTPKKGTDLLIQVLRHLKEINSPLKIHYFGHGGNDKYEKNIKKIIKDEDLPIVFEDVTNNIYLEYQKSLCLLMTSKAEGEGQVMYESVLTNTPILSNEFKYGLKDLLVEKENGYIYKDLDTFKDFDKAIENIREKQQKNEFKTINKTAEMFLEENVVNNWIDLLNKYMEM